MMRLWYSVFFYFMAFLVLYSTFDAKFFNH